MTDYITIKLFPPIISCDRDDDAWQSYDYYYSRLNAYAKERKRILCFARFPGSAEFYKGFADVEYSGEMTKQEQKQWVDLIRGFFDDTEEEYEFVDGQWKPRCKPKNKLKYVRFFPCDAKIAFA